LTAHRHHAVSTIDTKFITMLYFQPCKTEDPSAS